MAAGRGRIPGLAIVAVTVGAVVLLSASKNATIQDTLRAILRGERITGKPGLSGVTAASVSPGGSATGQAVAQAGLAYVGKVPYKWGGATPSGWDCSGFVTWVLHHDIGLKLPSDNHTVAIVFYGWLGATTVPRDQCQPGDLVCWTSHVGIAISSTEMVNAPHAGALTRVDKIWSVPQPSIRRPKAYVSAASIGNNLIGSAGEHSGSRP